MGTLAPFHCPWSVLIQDWLDMTKFSDQCPDSVMVMDTDTDSPNATFHVIRNLRLLSLLRNLLSGIGSVEGFVVDHRELIEKHTRGLVAVHVDYGVGGGTAEDFSTLSLLSEEDCKQLATSGRSFKGPTEPPHPDPFRKIKPAKERRKLQVQSVLAEKDSVVGHCSRKLIGYIVKGGYSFIKGSETAMGFCSLFGLLQLSRMAPKTAWRRDTLDVLTRHPHSLQYHVAGLSILPFSPDL